MQKQPVFILKLGTYINEINYDCAFCTVEKYKVFNLKKKE